MSELINNSASRRKSLEDFTAGLLNGGNGSKLMEMHQQVISTVTPFETMEVLDKLLVSGFSVEKVKTGVGKILNAFHKSLSASSWDKPGDGHFLYYMMLENLEAEKILNEIKSINRQVFRDEAKDRPELTSRLRLLMLRLKEYELHYIKKENILFPYIEKIFPQYRCLQIMWSFHDDFRKIIRKINLNLEDTEPDYDALNKDIGKLYFVILPIIFREEQIVFPVAMKSVPEKSWDEMLEQSFEQGWCYIRPQRMDNKSFSKQANPENLIDLGSGMMSPEQIRLVLNSSPVDITFIDENDEVRFFSESKDRIFPRSRAIIGRKVQNCHPPQSVHVVNEIIEAFRKGEKNQAEFWLQVKGRFIYIRYIALRNEAGKYSGTLEVSEDVTGVRSLVNERRLLKWNSED